ncbi:MBL fold metallo-hydrolase [Candidatus Sumerlaeota bacterium]|nr:MBL fold metallo-hydrolase [Candidatus Sumerlaeota bacterium]
MKIYTQALAVMLMLITGSAMAQQVNIGGDTMLTPIEHASLMIQAGEKTIYIDPVGDAARYAAFPRPELILITHIHGDHFNAETIAAVKTTDTVVIGPENVIAQLGYGQVIKNDESTTALGVRIEAIPAYNLSPERMKFHPRGRDNGYVLNLDGQRIYLSGDTEDIPEMRSLQDIDFAVICMNLPYTMTVEQAASAVLELKPKAVSPYHYRGPNGMSDLQEFQRLVGENPEIEVRLLDWYAQQPAAE